ncbi:MAG: hypothetical protein FRX48_08242 [Lasallia pustulata]|uniref:Uncharacterized protein n=1 Tax=Lasallia pustulata TaxID=136370 RepID=A0A5M8PF03_9LECA|nr:MAG: hypothetical protein FRX48_08242 [Lasallia pustulata]
MSSATSDTDGTKPKQTSSARTSHLNRDKPLFASRRPLPRLQQHSDFFTDSLNTSYIPGPSPQKNNANRQSMGAKPRQAFVNGRSLGAASKATANVAGENRPPSSPPSSDRKQPRHLAKPRSSQDTPRTPPRPSKSPPKEPERTRTARPRPRGQATAASPTSSASSPPRGLAEAYQRIVDEEDLAGQENEATDDGMDDMTSDEYHRIQTDRSHDIDHLRLQRLRDSASPISLRASRRASPRGAMGEILAAEDRGREHEQDLPEIGSEPGMSFLDDVTDDSIGRALAQHSRDEVRLNGVVKPDGQPFSKARVGEKVGLTVENLRRKNGSNGSSGSGTIGVSISSRGSEPSLNIPREWGRKGKSGKDWLSRINGRSGKFTGDVSIEPKVAITIDPERKESAGRIVDWVAAAADVPLPSVEEGSSHTRSASQNSTPVSILHGRTSLDIVREWEFNDDDFTARSLQISDSPPLRIRNATLDRIREREIESLEKRAVTTNRLDELREKSSLENLGRRSPNLRVEEPQRQIGSNMEEGSRRRTSSAGLSLQSISEDSSDHNDGLEAPVKSKEQKEQVPDTPVVIYKSTPETDNEHGGRSQSRSEKEKRPSSQAISRRDDPRDLLRSLARATSASPSPTKENEPDVHSDTEMSGDDEILQGTPDDMMVRAAAHTRHDSTGKGVSDHNIDLQPRSEGSKGAVKTPQLPKSKIYLETPLVTGAWIDTVKTPLQSQPKPAINLKTPLITGGWIDTPLPAGGRGLPMPTPEELDARKDLVMNMDDHLPKKKGLSPSVVDTETHQHEQKPLRDSGPERPKSALAAILEKAKRKPRKRRTADAQSSDEDNTLALGDDTIRSLEDLVVKDQADNSVLVVPREPAINVDSDDDNETSTLTSTQKARQTELFGYDRLTTRLGKLGVSIRDAKKGIATLEQAVSNNTAEEQCNEAGEFHDFIWPCQKCGCSGRNDGAVVRRGGDRVWEIAIPLPRLWRWDDGDWRPRLTWFGLVTLSAILLVAEIIVADLYSPPFYATHMVSFGVDLDRPLPPFILAKLLLRSPVGYIIKPPWFFFISVLKFCTRSLSKLVRFLYRLAFGGSDGAGYAARSGHGMRQPVARDTRIPRPSWAPDLSMMVDEYV